MRSACCTNLQQVWLHGWIQKSRLPGLIHPLHCPAQKKSQMALVWGCMYYSIESAADEWELKIILIFLLF